MRHVLAGDVGGTRARFALFLLDPSGAPRLIHQNVLSSRSYRSFESALKEFLDF